MKVNVSPNMTRYLVEKRVFRSHPFSLVDVGCSGGIEKRWREFGNQLEAVGFDPLVAEVERLNAAEQNPSIRYVASLVGCSRVAQEANSAPYDTSPYPRSSSPRAIELMRMDYARTYYDGTHDGRLSSELVELDEFFGERRGDVDFIKTDTDGHDIECLVGANALLSDAGPMGLAVETQFHGGMSRAANLFSNVDWHLRVRGYSVFGIDPKVYSKAALPVPFRWSHPAETHAGQVFCADAVFFRDVCLPQYEEYFGLRLQPHKLLKLCSAFELYGLEDCAAEVLLTFRERLKPLVDVDHCLDLLTPPLPDGRTAPYRKYIAAFEKNVEAFYSGR